MEVTLDDRLNVLQQISQRKLIDILEKIPGKKDLIIEQKLMKILDSFIGVTTLRRCGVEKIYKLEPGLKPSNTQRIFFVSNDLISCKKVLDQIQSERSQSHLSHRMLITPFIPYILHSLLEEQGLVGLVELTTFSWEFILVDGNVLSLEIPLFVDLYYHRNPLLLSALSRSLWSLKHVLGSPKLLLSFGKQSRQILTQIESLEENLGSPAKDTELGAFVIMDRNYDLATTLLTPVTYGGLLHQVMDIQVGVASLEKSQIKLDPRKDPIYKQVRDTPCSEVFPILHEKAKSLKSEQGAIQTMKLAEMERYIATKLHKSREMTQQLAFHISACQKITDTLGSSFQSIQSNEKSILDCKDRKECLNYIERNIDDFPLSSLRLLCLLSLTSDGITQNELHPIQKSHLHAHGYQNIPLFYKLRTAGLLRYKPDNLLHKLPNWNSEWVVNAQRLKILPNQREDNKPRICPSYVFNDAYIPVIAQILSLVARQNQEELINYPESYVQGEKGTLLPKIILICIVGGITWAEISACRLLEKSHGIRLVLVSDFLIQGNRIIEKIQKA